MSQTHFDYVMLFIGVLFLVPGIAILIKKEYFWISRSTNPQLWEKPTLMKGKKAISYGIAYTIFGVCFIILSVALYYFSTH